MVYSYTPTYYSSFQDTLSSLCKSILLPFSLKNRRLPQDYKLGKKQSDNLKWQQESFHKILNLIGLHKEGIVPESDVSAFRSHVLDTLIASPSEQEPVAMIRDKLLFLQELLYAKCISSDEYHSSKRPLLQRLAVQGVEINCKDVIMGGDINTTPPQEEEWSVIDLRDKESPAPAAAKTKHKAPIKSLINWRGNNNKNGTGSVLMPESSPKSEKTKRKPFNKKWGLEGFKKWKKSSNEEDELIVAGERSDGTDSSVACTLVVSPIGEGPDTKRIKDKIHSDGSSSDFFIDKVLGDNIKKELSRIQSELSSTHPNLSLSDDQMDAISTRLPVDKTDLNNFFPKSWCDRYGDIVLDVVKKEFKDHVGEMETLRNNAKERKVSGSGRWVAFEENEENFHPNLFRDHPALNQEKNAANCYVNNPFIDDQNPFWTASSRN